MPKETYLVTIDRPDDVTVTHIKNFIRDAVGTFGGSLRPPGGYSEDDPGDPMFGSRNVTVRKQKS